MPFYLFTYGTLMQNQIRHSILENEKFIQSYKLSGIKLYNYYDRGKRGETQNYPVALLGNESDITLGEIYLCEDYLLPYLNQMEQVGSLYNVYSFPLEIDGIRQDILIYIGIDETWKNFVGSKYLMPYQNNTLWKPTTN